MRRRQGTRLFGLGVVMVAIVAVGGLTGCEPGTNYISLGDSYTSGPLITDQTGEPLGCLRSDRNWPALTKPNIRVTGFRDMSCSGAQTNDMWSPQGVDPGGPNPAQLSVVDGAAKVVTLQIGGNDIGFSDIIKTCALQNPFGSGCTADYVRNGRDEISDEINATAPKIDAIVAEIKRKAPQAEVFLVGYPTLIPQSGNGCYPLVPVLAKDVPYLRAKTVELNGMIAARAAAAGVHYIDLYGPSAGHDFCASASNKWVEGIIPTAVAAPVHPNAKGMENFAAIVTSAINAVVTE
jgi:lysophospholipase L1-like esterase